MRVVVAALRSEIHAGPLDVGIPDLSDLGMREEHEARAGRRARCRACGPPAPRRAASRRGPQSSDGRRPPRTGLAEPARRNPIRRAAQHGDPRLEHAIRTPTTGSTSGSPARSAGSSTRVARLHPQRSIAVEREARLRLAVRVIELDAAETLCVDPYSATSGGTPGTQRCIKQQHLVRRITCTPH
jgi:hypothetical protein